jgi:queuine tRNA-ribosyltransferase
MKYEKLGVIPVLTSQAGSCLTGANWQEAGVRAASFDLTALLMKPGFDFLKTLPDLAAYVGWHDTLILNASLLKMGPDGRYALRSHYDGGRSYYSVEDILTLIAKLQPDIVILPEGLSQFWITLPKTILPFVPVEDLPNCSETERPYGVYIAYDKASSSSSTLFQQLDRHKDVLCYVAGDISLPLMIDLVGKGINFIESDIPASDACVGNVYCQEGVLSLQTKESATRFELIDKNCKCPVCSQNFTQAYLHHLLEHTPLLCQRYLVQHNLYHCQAAICR